MDGAEALTFDAVIGNPPYQEFLAGNRISKTIWPDFVKRGAACLKEGGVLAMIHPPGWRGLGVHFRAAKEILSRMHFRWISVNGESEGARVFRAATPFDAYVAVKGESDSLTEIEDMSGGTSMVDVGEWDFIPSSNFGVIRRILADRESGEEAVDAVHDVSMYDNRRDTARETRSEEYNLPCVRYIHRSGEASLWFAKDDRGHFGKPKVMFGIMANVGAITIDERGEYGLSRYMAGIHDDPGNLGRIQSAMRSGRFREVMKSVKFTTQEYNLAVIRRFRRDFWKEFVNDDGDWIDEDGNVIDRSGARL